VYQQAGFAGQCQHTDKLWGKRQIQGKILKRKWDAAEGQKERKEPRISVARN